MKAMILAAGKGTRVRPITHLMPKPMIPILQKPVMEFLVELLRQHGVDRIMINTSHLADQIESYFRDGHQWGVKIGFSFEGSFVNGQPVGQALGSAGGLRKIQDFSGFFDETFVVLCGDALIDLDITEVVKFHKSKHSVATIVLRQVPWEEVPSYGVVVTDNNGLITAFQEKPNRSEALSNTINTGIYVFEPDIFDFIPSEREYDIGKDLFPDLVKAGAPFYGITSDFQWVDIGKTPDLWLAIQKVLSDGIRGFQMPGEEIAPGVWTGLNVKMNLDDIEIVPPVYIGSSTEISPGATIVGPTSIGSGCFLSSGCVVEQSVIFDYTHLSSQARVRKGMVCGPYWITAEDGDSIDTESAQLSWLIGDSRSTVRELEPEEDLIIQEMRQNSLE